MFETAPLLGTAIAALLASTALIFLQKVFNETAFVKNRCAGQMAFLSIAVFSLLVLLLAVEVLGAVVPDLDLAFLIGPLALAIVILLILVIILLTLQYGLPFLKRTMRFGQAMSILKKLEQIAAKPGQQREEDLVELAADLAKLVDAVLGDPDLDVEKFKESSGKDLYAILVKVFGDLIDVLIGKLRQIIQKPDVDDETKEKAGQAIDDLAKAKEKWKELHSDEEKPKPEEDGG